MSYDLFISYSRRDNERGQVAALKIQIESSFRAFAGRDLRVFFDTHEIAGMDDWRQKIQRSLRDSQVFLAVLSPHYLASPYCRWEWEDYVRYEAMRQCLGEGVAPVFFVTLPDAADPKTDQAIARWIDEIQRRQTFDLRPWHDAGKQALEQVHVRQTLDQLHASVRERLDRAERSRSSPNNLIKHNSAFVGRVRELTELRQALTKNKLGVVGAREGQTPSQPSTINSQHSAVVQGLGGMGKTELALAYAHAFAWDYPGGRWQIPCEHLSDLRVVLLHLANANALNFEFTEDEKKDIALAFERVLRELNRRERCLLILDNVSDPNLLQPEYLDRLPRDGRVDLIATTRLAPRAIPGAANEQTFIAVDELPEEDALALMRSHQPDGRFVSQQEDDEARAIVRLLRGFTLAVETAGIYLGRHAASDACRKFRERLSPELLRESETAATDPAVAVRHRVRSLEETLALTLRTLIPEALHLLEVAALLPPDQIACAWLRTVAGKRFPIFRDAARGLFRQQNNLLFDLRLFQSTGILDAEGLPLTARMHRLVQAIVAERTMINSRDLLAELVDCALARCAWMEAHSTDPEAQKEVFPLKAFASQLLESEGLGGAFLGTRLGALLDRLGRFREAETLLRRSLERRETLLGEEHEETLEVLNNLGVLLTHTAEYMEAEQVLRRLVSTGERVWGEAHPNVAASLNHLSKVLKHTGRLAEAEPLMRRALAIAENSFGPADPRVAIALNNLAILFMETNRLPEAEPLMRRALAIDEAKFGKDHPSVARDLGYIASLLRAKGSPTEAEPIMLRAITIDEAKFGKDHPDVAFALSNLSGLLQDTNRFSEAEPRIRKALAIYEASYGKDHPNVARILNNLAQLLNATNRVTEAEPMMRRALAINEATFGECHPDVASCLHNIAALLRESRRCSEAEPLIRRALAIWEKSLGGDHASVAIALNELALLLQATNRLKEAEPLMRRQLEIFFKLSMNTGQQHRHLQDAISNYVALLTQMHFPPQQVQARLDELGLRFGVRIEVSFPNEGDATVPRVAKTGPTNRAFPHRPETPEVVDEDALRALRQRMDYFTGKGDWIQALACNQKGLEITFRFKAATGREHSSQQLLVDKFKAVLTHMGHGQSEVLAQLNAMAKPFGIHFGSGTKD